MASYFPSFFKSSSRLVVSIYLQCQTKDQRYYREFAGRTFTLKGLILLAQDSGTGFGIRVMWTASLKDLLLFGACATGFTPVKKWDKSSCLVLFGMYGRPFSSKE